MGKLSLYNLTQEMLSLEEMLLADGGEITQEYESLDDQIRFAIMQKTDNIVELARKFEDEIELAKKHERKLAEYRKARDNAIKRLKDYAQQALAFSGESKLKGAMCEISMSKPAQRVDITDQDKLPGRFKRLDVKIETAEIKRAIKDGETIPGAALVDGKRSIKFKLKSVK